MTLHSHGILLALIALASTSVAVAQTPPTQDTTAPSAASSPHQRDSTSTPAAEAAAPSGAKAADAATPHQKQAMADKAMKDCMTKQQAKDSSLSKDRVKKACTVELKKQ